MKSKTNREMAKILKSTDLECFQQQGYVRIPEAFSPADALAMQDFIWDKLEEKCSILRSDPNTWDKHVTGLNKSAENAIYSDITSQRMCRAIDDLLGEGTWEAPKKWGSFLVSFPQKLDHDWTVPISHCNGVPWHWDGRSGIEDMENLSGVFVFTVGWWDADYLRFTLVIEAILSKSIRRRSEPETSCTAETVLYLKPLVGSVNRSR